MYIEKSIGLKAYNNHKEPSKEMLSIWKLKEELKTKILKKHKDIDEDELLFKTPEQLQEILTNIN